MGFPLTPSPRATSTWDSAGKTVTYGTAYRNLARISTKLDTQAENMPTHLLTKFQLSPLLGLAVTGI